MKRFNFILLFLIFSFSSATYGNGNIKKGISDIRNEGSDTTKKRTSLIIPYLGFSLITGSKFGLIIPVSKRIAVEGIYGRLFNGLLQPPQDYRILSAGLATNYYLKKGSHVVLNFTWMYSNHRVIEPNYEYLSKKTMIFSPCIGFLPLRKKEGNKGFGLIIRGGVFWMIDKPIYLDNYSFAPVNAPPFGVLGVAPNLDFCISYGF